MITLAELLSGLGLLFVGLRLIGQHLRQAAGHRVRLALRTATESRWSGLLAGTLAGAVTQSSNAVTLITANLVHSRALTVNQAAPVVAGASAGTALLVFLATLDMRLVVLYLVAATGLSVHFKLDYHAARRDWIWAALGLALLFMGLDLIKHAPNTLSADAWRVLLGEGISAPAAVGLGFVIALVTQSASTGTILAIAGMYTGFIRFDSAFWIMTGANLGSGFAVLLSGVSLKGSGRQLCEVHISLKMLGSALVAAAWTGYAARTGDAAAAVPPEEAASLLAILFLAMQLAGALPLTLLRDSVVALTARLTPVDPIEQASQPHYIYDRAVEDPVNALTLARLERDRLTQFLPKLLPDLDAEQADALTVRRHLLAGHRNVAAQTASFLLTVMGRGLTRDDLARAANEQSSLENVQTLQDTLAEFSNIVDAWRGERPNLLFSLCEGLRTLICLLAETTDDAGRKADPHDMEMLIQLSGDRGEMLERVRSQLMQSDMHDGAQTRELLMATRLFERAVWLVRRIAIARREQGAGTGMKIAAADPPRQIEDAQSG